MRRKVKGNFSKRKVETLYTGCSHQEQIDGLIDSKDVFPSHMGQVVTLVRDALRVATGKSTYSLYCLRRDYSDVAEKFESVYHYLPGMKVSGNAFVHCSRRAGISIYKVITDVYLYLYRGIEWSLDVLCIDSRTDQQIKLREAAEQFRPLVRKDVTLDDVILPKQLKDEIVDDIETFRQSRSLYESALSLPWKRGYVFYGPPGNGKTLLIKALAGSYNLGLEDLKSYIEPDGTLSLENDDDWLYGEPSIYYLEDLDKCTAFQSTERDFASIPLYQLLQGLDGVDEVSGALIIATTNDPEGVSQALMNRPGRFDRVWEIPLPDEDCILRLFNKYKLQVVQEDKKVTPTIAKSLVGLSMAHVEEVVKSAISRYCSTTIEQNKIKEIIKRVKSHDRDYKKGFQADETRTGTHL